MRAPRHVDKLRFDWRPPPAKTDMREVKRSSRFDPRRTLNGMCRSDLLYLFERLQVAGAVPNAFLKAREKAASEP